MKNSITIIALCASLMPLSMQCNNNTIKHLLTMEEGMGQQIQVGIPFEQTEAYHAIEDAISQRPYRILDECVTHGLKALMVAHVAMGSLFVAATIMGQ